MGLWEPGGRQWLGASLRALVYQLVTAGPASKQAGAPRGCPPGLYRGSGLPYQQKTKLARDHLPVKAAIVPPSYSTHMSALPTPLLLAGEKDFEARYLETMPSARSGDNGGAAPQRASSAPAPPHALPAPTALPALGSHRDLLGRSQAKR